MEKIQSELQGGGGFIEPVHVIFRVGESTGKQQVYMSPAGHDVLVLTTTSRVETMLMQGLTANMRM